MKKALSLVLSLLLVFSLCIVGASAADKTITPSATIGGQTVTMTATGLQTSFTKFDMSVFGQSGVYVLAMWFDHSGTFSFDKTVTLTRVSFDADWNMTTETVDCAAGVVYRIADGVNGGSWSEFSIALDNGNSWMILDSSNPGNYGSYPADTALSSFPGTVGDIPQPEPEPEPEPAQTPAEQTPAEQTPAEQTPSEQTPSEQPPAPAPAPAEIPEGARTYTVVAGDCLWSIAQRFYGTGTRWGELWEANAATIRNPRMIYPGQVIIVP